MAARQGLGRRRGQSRQGWLRVRRRGARLPRPARSTVLRVPAAAVGARGTASRGCRVRPHPQLHPASHVETTDAAAATCRTRDCSPARCSTPTTSSKLATAGFTGKGQTIVIFAFDGSTRPTSTASRPCTSCRGSPPPWSAASPPNRAAKPRWTSKSPTPLRPTPQKVVINARPTVEGEGGVYEKIAQMLESADRAVPRRGVELLDRLGLRQAGHRGRSGAGAVGTLRRTRQRHNGLQRQRRPRGSGMQGRRRTGRRRRATQTSGSTRSPRCRR